MLIFNDNVYLDHFEVIISIFFQSHSFLLSEYLHSWYHHLHYSITLHSGLTGKNTLHTRLQGNHTLHTRLQGNHTHHTRLQGNHTLHTRLQGNHTLHTRLRGTYSLIWLVYKMDETYLFICLSEWNFLVAVKMFFIKFFFDDFILWVFVFHVKTLLLKTRNFFRA